MGRAALSHAGKREKKKKTSLASYASAGSNLSFSKRTHPSLLHYVRSLPWAPLVGAAFWNPTRINLGRAYYYLLTSGDAVPHTIWGRCCSVSPRSWRTATRLVLIPLIGLCRYVGTCRFRACYITVGKSISKQVPISTMEVWVIVQSTLYSVRWLPLKRIPLPDASPRLTTPCCVRSIVAMDFIVCLLYYTHRVRDESTSSGAIHICSVETLLLFFFFSFSALSVPIHLQRKNLGRSNRAPISIPSSLAIAAGKTFSLVVSAGALDGRLRRNAWLSAPLHV